MTQHKKKISLEANRYQAMVQERDDFSKKWDEQARERRTTLASYL